MSNATGDVILICTSEDGLNGIITSLLETKGIKLISALNQHMLFSLIELYSPMVVIADSGLSQMMGYTPCEIIKRIDRFRDTHVILITTETTKYNNNACDCVDEVIDSDSVNSVLFSAICKYSSCAPDMQINEDARRLARAIVSDIVHYNSDAAYRGAADGTFYDTLSKEIEKGRAVYQKRISVNMPSLPDYFNDAIRDFLNKNQQCNLVLP